MAVSLPLFAQFPGRRPARTAAGWGEILALSPRDGLTLASAWIWRGKRLWTSTAAGANQNLIIGMLERRSSRILSGIQDPTAAIADQSGVAE